MSAGAELDMRAWTNQKGQSFEGRLVQAMGDRVVIESKDGRKYTVAPGTLSDADQGYIAAHYSELQKGAAPVVPDPKVVPTPEKRRREVQPEGDGEEGGGDRGGMLAGYDASVKRFGGEWPPLVKCEDKVEIQVIREDAESRTFIYESPHFRFESNAKMRQSLISKIALLFESSFLWHKSVPLNNRRTWAKDAPKLKAKLFETMDEYHAAGGPGGSSGVYMPGKDTFMVPFSEVGAKKVGSGYMYDFNGDPQTMLHELTHQMWADIGGSSPIWLTEGFAEYMGCVPYRGGAFSYGGHARAIHDYALSYGKKGKGGRGLGERFSMPHLKTLMGMTQAQFYSNGNQNYGYGLIMTTYFLDMDGEKDGALMKKAIEAMQAGKEEDEVNRVLLNGRTYEQLEKDFAHAWRGAGAAIEFR